MNCFMATSRPASPLLDVSKSSMINPANHQGIATVLREMTLQAKVGVANLQHLCIRAAMDIMTGGTPFSHGLMLENIGSGLRRVTLRTGSACWG
jgi:hypothetical protein